MDFETEPGFDDDPTAFTDSFGRPDVPTDPERIAAPRSDAPSTMRKVEHGVTVNGRDPAEIERADVASEGDAVDRAGAEVPSAEIARGGARSRARGEVRQRRGHDDVVPRGSAGRGLIAQDPVSPGRDRRRSIHLSAAPITHRRLSAPS
jgi:hypothetical protein